MDEAAADRLEPLRLTAGGTLCFALAATGHLAIAAGIAAVWLAGLAVRETIEGRQA